MNATRAIIITSAIGTTAGLGYALARHLRNGRSAQEADDDPAEAAAENIDPQPDQAASDPQTAPAGDARAPLAEPSHADGTIRINHSENVSGRVLQSPGELLAQARRHAPEITREELTAARLAASEHGSGTMTELACIIDAELNRAARHGRSLFDSLTRGAGFGKQGRERPASTRRDPRMRHLWAARQVLTGGARGISRGAERFFDPLAMDRLHRKYRAWLDGGKVGEKPAIVSCDALTLLETWSFDYAKQGASRCPPDRSRTGRHPLAWVGPIADVDASRLMLMAPMDIGEEHAKRYQDARQALIEALTPEVA